MPRIVRNFWVDLKVDGRKSKIGTGPKSRFDGLAIDLQQRSGKTIAKKYVAIRCHEERGSLCTRVELRGGDEVITLLEYWTARDDAAVTANAIKYTKPKEVARRHALSVLNAVKNYANDLTIEDIKRFCDDMLFDKL